MQFPPILPRRGSEPFKDLSGTLSIFQPKKCNSICEKSKRRPRPIRGKYTHHIFVFSFDDDNRQECDIVSTLLKSNGFLCVDSHSDIKPNEPEYAQISNMMTKSQWIVLLFSKLSLCWGVEGYVQYVTSMASNLAERRKRNCLISVVQNANYTDFIPSHLSPYFFVNQNKPDWQSSLLHIVEKKTSESIRIKNAWSNSDHDRCLSQSYPNTARRMSLPGQFLSLSDIFQKTHFCEPLGQTLAVAANKHGMEISNISTLVDKNYKYPRQASDICSFYQLVLKDLISEDTGDMTKRRKADVFNLPKNQGKKNDTYTLTKSTTEKANNPVTKLVESSPHIHLPPIAQSTSQAGRPSLLSSVIVTAGDIPTENEDIAIISKGSTGMSERQKALERVERFEQKFKRRELQTKSKTKQ